tara:strand:- start:5703 stop:6659 length:957 start_codon:yes stop_codon:yes gene_type:complete
MKPLALVLGCTGQDGSYLSKSLIEKGFSVIGTSRKAKANLQNLSVLKISKKIKIVRCDLEDYSQTEKLIKNFEPDEIYNLSAQSSVGQSFQKPLETHHSIVNTTLNILEASRQLEFKGNIFLAGSSEIFGATKTPATINTPPDLRSPYALAKYNSLLLCKLYRLNYQLHCTTGILFNHESKIRDQKFVMKKIIIDAIKIKNNEIQKLIIGNIKIKRDWGWAEEYVEAMQLINRSKSKKDYIICTGESYSLEYIIKKVFDKLGLNWKEHIKISSKFYRENEIDTSEGDPLAIYNDLGWKARVKIDELIERLIKYELKNK